MMALTTRVHLKLCAIWIQDIGSQSQDTAIRSTVFHLSVLNLLPTTVTITVIEFTGPLTIIMADTVTTTRITTIIITDMVPTVMLTVLMVSMDTDLVPLESTFQMVL